MQFDGFRATLGTVCLALFLNFSAGRPVHSEEPPPDQTETDGGAGNSDSGEGAGNGGSGVDKAGQTTAPPSCSVVNPPSWFPVGPPVSEAIQVVGGPPLNVVVHTVIFDTNGRFAYSYFSTFDDPITPIPGTGEMWADNGTGSSAPKTFYCAD